MCLQTGRFPVLWHSQCCAFRWKSFHMLVWKRRQKCLKFEISHFDWLFLSDIVAVRGLTAKGIGLSDGFLKLYQAWASKIRDPDTGGCMTSVLKDIKLSAFWLKEETYFFHGAECPEKPWRLVGGYGCGGVGGVIAVTTAVQNSHKDGVRKATVEEQLSNKTIHPAVRAQLHLPPLHLSWSWFNRAGITPFMPS